MCSCSVRVLYRLIPFTAELFELRQQTMLLRFTKKTILLKQARRLRLKINILFERLNFTIFAHIIIIIILICSICMLTTQSYDVGVFIDNCVI